MKCKYCDREVTPIGVNCPKCKAQIVNVKPTVKLIEIKPEVKSNGTRD